MYFPGHYAFRAWPARNGVAETCAINQDSFSWEKDASGFSSTLSLSLALPSSTFLPLFPSFSFLFSDRTEIRLTRRELRAREEYEIARNRVSLANFRETSIV